MSQAQHTVAAGPTHLADLVYELLDAHADTVSLIDEPAGAGGWVAHLAYLRDLQRVGRELLAASA